MFEENDGQNGSQSNQQSGSTLPYGIARPSALDNNAMTGQISSGQLFPRPQLSAPLGGAFTNQNALKIDPETDNAYPKFGLPAANTQTTASQKPASLPPINPRDEQGKTLPKYRMGIGHRILASVANFANGFAGNGAAPLYVGPGALNNRYYQDEAFRQKQNEWNEPSVPDRYRSAIDWRTILQDPVSKRWYGKTYGGQKQEIGTPPWASGTEAQDDGANNKDDVDEVPEMGAQVTPGPKSARERFEQVRKSRNSYR
jgi:hypothetical protein